MTMYLGVRRQLPEDVDQILVHLLRVPLEEPAAAAEEERVPGEDDPVRGGGAGHVVADVARGVARREQAGDLQPAHPQRVAVLHQPGDPVYPRVPADDVQPRHLGHHLLVAPGVVPVVVGGQHGGQHHPLLLDRPHDGVWVDGVHDGGLPGLLVDQEVHVVVGEGGQDPHPHAGGRHQLLGAVAAPDTHVREGARCNIRSGS